MVSVNQLFYEELVIISIITLGLGYLIYKIVDGRPVSALPRLREIKPEKTRVGI